MEKKSIKYKFKKGDTFQLDEIYLIQGLCGGRWWEYIDGTSLERIIITKNITIMIVWWE